MIAIPLKRCLLIQISICFLKKRANEAEENEIPEIPDEIDLIELELVLQHFSQCKGHVQH